MDGCDLSFEGGIHESVPGEHGLLIELRGDNDGVEGLTASSCKKY